MEPPLFVKLFDNHENDVYHPLILKILIYFPMIVGFFKQGWKYTKNLI